jgi:serine protease inhibitor
VTQLGFELALHRAIAPDPGRNACWSPYSVASALGLLATGARGMTRDELVTLLLGEKSGDLGAFTASLGRTLGDGATLEVANTLWADNGIEIRAEFSESVRPAPFRDAPDRARQLINQDVADTTHGLITDLVPDGAITDETVAALVNALYLRCAWRLPFIKGATKPHPFHTPHGTVEVPTMELAESIGYAATAGWQVVVLPADGGVQAVVLLPDKELSAAEPELSAAALAELLAAPKPTQVRLRLPKIDLSMGAELGPALRQLGVRTAFTDDADLSGISPNHLAVQAVLHRAVLRLDEQGLEGAAATAVTMRLVSMAMREVEVTVDRPFLLLIRHPGTGVGYFLARVVTPGA